MVITARKIYLGKSKQVVIGEEMLCKALKVVLGGAAVRTVGGVWCKGQTGEEKRTEENNHVFASVV